MLRPYNLEKVILYDSNGKVKNVALKGLLNEGEPIFLEEYICVSFKDVLTTQIRKIRKKKSLGFLLKKDYFHRGRFYYRINSELVVGSLSEKKINFEGLPPLIQEIFNAGTREKVSILRSSGELEDFVDLD